jgi:hypothetical protein
MMLRVACALAVVFAVAGAAHAADSGKKSGTTDTGAKNLTIPSVELGGGSLGVTTSKPNDSNVPGFNDPQKQDKPFEPFVGLHFSKPLTGK